MSFMESSSSSQSYENKEDYFGVDDILTTQEKLPCKFETQVYNLGEIIICHLFLGDGTVSGQGIATQPVSQVCRNPHVHNHRL